MSQAPFGATRNCVSCGRSIAWDANVCPYCGHDYRMQAMPGMGAPSQSPMPMIGGILVLIAGLIEIGYGALMIGGGTFFVDIGAVGGVLAACGAIAVILGIIAILGGIFAIQRKHFGLAILGSILGLGGWFIPALIGLILIAVSKEEFSD